MRQQLRRGAVALQRTGQHAAQLGNAHPVQVYCQARLQALYQRQQQGMGSRRITQAARYHDHLDCLTHLNLPPMAQQCFAVGKAATVPKKKFL
ncbi:hypothetical protein D3C76_1580900 [compost metagenome]